MKIPERPELVAVSPAMRRVVEEAEAIARFDDVPVLIAGESGTGKELLARLVHAGSPRGTRPFVAVNAAALPDALLEAELFGHARGAFTGAQQSRKGLLDEADGGTLFLDEVADLSPRAQTVLLRALQEREFRRLGETASRKSNFRVVTATHKSLPGEACAGRFRRDLLFRLDVARIELPPLRERPADILPLARRFIDRFCRRANRAPVALAPSAERVLLGHSWPGNVRELENELTQALVRSGGRGSIRPEHLSIVRRGTVGPGLRAASRAFEKAVIAEALAHHGGNRTRAARALGLSRQGLYRKLKRHGITDAETTGLAARAESI